LNGIFLSNILLLAAADTPQMADRLFNLDGQLINDAVLVLISVFTLFFVASKSLFNPVRKVLDNRREKIKNELESAAADKEAAEAMKKEYEAKLAGINAEAEGILNAARKQALALENASKAQAKEDAAHIMAQAQKEAELEKEKAKDAVKTEIIEIAALMATKAIADQINIQVQEKLINDALKEMGKSTWQS
jgi:F-type H+-transporting ATPase subunit b